MTMAILTEFGVKLPGVNNIPARLLQTNTNQLMRQMKLCTHAGPVSVRFHFKSPFPHASALDIVVDVAADAAPESASSASCLPPSA